MYLNLKKLAPVRPPPVEAREGLFKRFCREFIGKGFKLDEWFVRDGLHESHGNYRTCQFFFIVGFKVFFIYTSPISRNYFFDGKVNKDHNDDTSLTGTHAIFK